jgi:O-antigen ligase
VLTSSRAATAAAVAGLATIVWLRLRAKGKPALLLAGIGLIFAALLTATYGEVLYRVLDQFYSLSTADRGLGSGATGRTAAWKATWDLFVRHPALGVGFRAHEQSLGVDSSAHNGYLATLAEIGLPGFLAVLYLVVRGMRLLRAGANEPETGFTHSLLFGFCIAYLILAVFERYLINVGNPTSLLFLLCLMRPEDAKADVMQEDESWLPSEETGDDADRAAASV